MLLDERNGRYWMLNRTGAVVLRCPLDGESPERRYVGRVCQGKGSVKVRGNASRLIGGKACPPGGTDRGRLVVFSVHKTARTHGKVPPARGGVPDPVRPRAANRRGEPSGVAQVLRGPLRRGTQRERVRAQFVQDMGGRARWGGHHGGLGVAPAAVRQGDHPAVRR